MTKPAIFEATLTSTVCRRWLSPLAHLLPIRVLFHRHRYAKWMIFWHPATVLGPHARAFLCTISADIGTRARTRRKRYWSMAASSTTSRSWRHSRQSAPTVLSAMWIVVWFISILIPSRINRLPAAVCRGFSQPCAGRFPTCPAPMALWAGVIMGFTLLGLASLLLGLILVIPLLGHASWHAYRDLVEAATPDINTGEHS